MRKKMMRVMMMTALGFGFALATGCSTTDMSVVSPQGEVCNYKSRDLIVTKEIKSAKFNPETKFFELEGYSKDVNQQLIASVMSLVAEISQARTAEAIAKANADAVSQGAIEKAVQKYLRDCADGTCD